MTRVPVDCLILGQQLQQHEQAAEPQQQASCTQRARGEMEETLAQSLHDTTDSDGYEHDNSQI